MKPHRKGAVITLLENGVPQREISRKTGIDRKTIRKIARELAASEGADPPKSPTPATGSEPESVQNPPPRPPVESVATGYSPTPSACEPHRDWIEAQVRLGRNATAIYQELVDQRGFTYGYNSVKRFCRRLRTQEPKQFDRLEFLPGEEAQVDYGEGALTRHPKSGRYRRPRLFVMTLRYSRRSFRKVVWRSSAEVWARLHEEAWSYFGGSCRYVVLDYVAGNIIELLCPPPLCGQSYAQLATIKGGSRALGHIISYREVNQSIRDLSSFQTALMRVPAEYASLGSHARSASALLRRVNSAYRFVVSRFT